MTLTLSIGMSLENKLETAYAGILAQIDSLDDGTTKILLNSTQLINEPDQSQDAGDDSNKPIPNITLIAVIGAESIPNTGIREAKLTIEVTDNANREGSDGNTLDRLFTTAITPLFIKDDGSGNSFSKLLSAQVDNFHCYGQPQRIDETGMRKEGDLVTRFAITTLHVCPQNDS